MKKGLLGVLICTIVIILLTTSISVYAGYDVGVLDDSKPSLFIDISITDENGYFGFFKINKKTDKLGMSIKNNSGEGTTVDYEILDSAMNVILSDKFEEDILSNDYTDISIPESDYYFIDLKNPKFSGKDEIKISICIYCPEFGGTPSDKPSEKPNENGNSNENGLSGNNNQENKPEYTWERIGFYSKLNDWYSTRHYYTDENEGMKGFRMHFDDSHADGTQDYGDMYFWCEEPPASIEAGTEFSIKTKMQAIILRNDATGYPLLSCRILKLEPGLDYDSTNTSGIFDAQYYYTDTGNKSSERTVNIYMDKSTEVGERLSIYLRTSAGLYEWQYELKRNEQSSVQTKKGDVNNDGGVDAKDVTMLRRYLAGGWNVEVNIEAADIDADGYVTAKDVTMLRRYLAGGWGVVLN